MDTLTILGVLLTIGGIIVTIIAQNRNSAKDKSDIITTSKNEGDSVRRKIDQLTEGTAEYQKILLTPENIAVAAKVNRDIPIVVTNNFPYPVFMVVIKIVLTKGNFDLNNMLIQPLGVGIWQSKYMTYQIPQINQGASVNLIATIRGASYSEHSEIKLSIVKYFKEPVTNFTMEKMDSLPKTIKLPDNFIPKPSDNK